jgi:hypothetical protein
MGEEVKVLEKRVDKLEKRVNRLEKDFEKFAGTIPTPEVVYSEDNYRVIKSTEIFGGYVVVTPEGEQYPYGDLKRAIEVLKKLKSR